MTDTTPTEDTPIVVLVHGAFVDGSSWAGVIAELKAAGVDVIAPPNMLRGIGPDAAYLTGLVDALDRPVVLVGHSYGGAVITQAGADAARVAGLVYVAAFAPEEGEPLVEINARYPDVPLAAALRTFNYTNEDGEEATEAFVDRRAVPRRRLRRRARGRRRPARPHPTPRIPQLLRLGGHRDPRMEVRAVLGRRRHRRSCDRPGRGAGHGRPGRRRDHRGRRVARRRRVTALRGRRRHLACRQGRTVTTQTDPVATAAAVGGSFGPIRQIIAGELDVGYVDVGPPRGQAVVLLHGWPYDIHAFEEATGPLAAAGYRVLVPYLRGHGPTAFLSDDTVRGGEQAALAVDAIAFMDALGIDQAIVAGFDWGARTVNVLAALWPERCRAMVSVSGYLIGSQAANVAPLTPAAEQAWWYQYYFATERGRAGYEAYRREFAHLIWRTASPQWDFDDETFERSAAAFDNADHVAIVIDNYRWRIGLSPGEDRYMDLEAQLATFPHRSADDHPRRRRQRRPPPRTCRLRVAVHRQVPPPDPRRRDRPQPPAGSTRSLRRRDPRSRHVHLTRRTRCPRAQPTQPDGRQPTSSSTPDQPGPTPNVGLRPQTRRTTCL